MVARAEDHRGSRYILIGRVKSTKDKDTKKVGPFIPEQHYYCKTQMDYKWNGAYLHGFYLTELGLKFSRDNRITCRYCDSVSIGWGKRGDLPPAELSDLRTRRIKFLRRHEDICKVADSD